MNHNGEDPFAKTALSSVFELVDTAEHLGIGDGHHIFHIVVIGQVPHGRSKRLPVIGVKEHSLRNGVVFQTT